MDLSLMYCLANNIKINFPALFIAHLSHCIANKNRVGYGNLISIILKKCNISLPSHPSFDLEPENYLTKDTLSRLSLRVQKGHLELDVEEVEVKVEADVTPSGKRKRGEDQGTGVKQSVRKSQRLAEPRRNQDSEVMIDLVEDQAPPTSASQAVDFPLLSTTGLHSILKEIQGSIALLGTRVQNLEARIAHQDVQQDKLLQEIKNGETKIREKIDSVVASFTIRK